MPDHDAVLILSFGGPEGPDDVMPFLRNVTRGRRVPEARLLEVAQHYQAYGGCSPINDQNRALCAALRAELTSHGPRLPVYFGNRNWHPLLEQTLREMADDGVRRALTFVTSAFSSYSGCRQYREDIARAREAVGERAPQLDKLRGFFNHPGFIEPVTELTRAALEAIPTARRSRASLAFTAHSIPLSMARRCAYEQQLKWASDFIADALGVEDRALVYQSRSGPPNMPWLEPDICDHLDALTERDIHDVVIVPLGFVSDHMEVIHDLDTEARERAEALGMNMVRASSVGAHPRFVRMIRELLLERIEDGERLSIGALPARPHVCPVDCCA